MKNSNPDVSIILPAFNEGAIIGNVVLTIKDILTANGTTFEILVIDYVLGEIINH